MQNKSLYVVKWLITYCLVFKILFIKIKESERVSRYKWWGRGGEAEKQIPC